MNSDSGSPESYTSHMTAWSEERWSQTHRPEYCAWRNIIHRCTNSDHEAYPNYGGRGITVCDAWINDVAQFISDMGRRPGPGYSIDRIDNDKGYMPSNCRWVTRSTQQLNRRNTKSATINGRTQTLKEWAIETGVPYHTLITRLRRGDSGDDLIRPSGVRKS